MNTNLAKSFTLNLHPKNTLIFFSGTLLSISIFFRTPEILHLHFFPPLHTLKIFLRTLRFFFLFHKTLRFFFTSLHRHLTFFFDFKKNLANVHPRTIEKFLSNIECDLHRNFLKQTEITQSNIIEFIATRHTHTHTYLVRSKEICAANSEFNRVSRENSA